MRTPITQKPENGKITEIDSLVTKKGDWLFNAENYLKYSTAEDGEQIMGRQPKVKPQVQAPGGVK